MTAQEIRDKRGKAIADARAILDAAGDKGLTAEQTATYDAFMDEAKAHKATLDRLTELEAQERSIKDAMDAKRNVAPLEVRGAAPMGVPDLPFPESQDMRKVLHSRTEPYKAAWSKALRFGTESLNRDEMRSLTIGTDSAGGYLAPDEFSRALIQDLNVPTVVRQRATVLAGVSGDRQIPFVSSHGSASWTGEEKSFAESDEAFGLKTIGAHKLTRIIKVSLELMQDSVFDLEAYLRAEFARAFNAAEDTAFIAGTGVGQPRGFTLDGTAGVSAAGSTSVTADELIDLYHAMSIPHRPNAVFVMADATLKAIRKLKSGDGQYLWVPGIQAGQSDTLLGRPVVVSDDVPAMTSGLRPIWFVNLGYYYIVDRAGFYLQLLRELYAATGQVAFLGYKRTDGRLILNTPAQYILMA